MAGNFENLGGLSFSDRFLFKSFGQGSNSKSPYSLVHRAFESVSDRNPSLVAVEYDGKSITYSELEISANVLANRLLQLGLEPRQRICLLVQRSIPMVIAILAVLKCGCQYIPLDGKVTPDLTLSHVLKDTQAPFILCLGKFYERASSFADPNTRIIVMDAPGENSISSMEIRPSVETHERDGAYIIYTSGSTGTPKGVDVSHMNVTNLLTNHPGRLMIREGTKVAQLLSISFDMGQWEILGTLMNGGTLYIRTNDWPAVLSKVDTVIATPSILATFDREKYPNITTIALAGEPCPQALADEWSNGRLFYNCCGPTEVTIVNTMSLHFPGQKISIGGPAPNTNVYVLDENENPLPIGETGVMWAGGKCVSRGYLNLPEKTAERYKRDKFLNDGSLMFNTGDLGRWMEDGTLEHLGRVDDQVKIKGFRVELDSVSAAIEGCASVTKGCAVFSDKVLYGFYSGPVDVGETILKDTVGKKQPYYAVPSKWVYRKEFPVTSNGKIDKRALMSSIGLNISKLPAASNPIIAQPLIKPTIATSLTPPATPPERSDEVDEKFKLYPATTITSVPGSKMSSTQSESSTSLPNADQEKYAVPGKNGVHSLRSFRFRIFDLYRRFFTVVFAGNLAALIYIATRPLDTALSNMATATAANLCTAILMRQDYVVNFLFTTLCSIPVWAPLFVRKHAARVYHIGGIHSSAATFSTIWFMVFTISATVIKSDSAAVLAVSYIIVALLVGMLATAYPTFRIKHHDMFERLHRFAGWSALALFWVQSILVADADRGTSSLAKAVISTPVFWLLIVATIAVILPWLNLRKVNVRSEVLSDHAVRLHFDYATPVVGTAVRLSEKPLVEWHAFATISKPGEKGFSVVVSKVGDWTTRQIQTAPTKMWVKGVPTCGVLRIGTLFKSMVLVATGSGIGPCLPVILAKKIPVRIFWSTPNPEKTFGKEIIDAVKAGDPRAIIHDTKTMGRPDMVAITWRLVMESGAEAVGIISNKKLTQKVVYGMEARGVPAYGAIFDS